MTSFTRWTRWIGLRCVLRWIDPPLFAFFRGFSYLLYVKGNGIRKRILKYGNRAFLFNQLQRSMMVGTSGWMELTTELHSCWNRRGLAVSWKRITSNAICKHNYHQAPTEPFNSWEKTVNSPINWICYLKRKRTNNATEGWHKRLRAKVHGEANLN